MKRGAMNKDAQIKTNRIVYLGGTATIIGSQPTLIYKELIEQ